MNQQYKYIYILFILEFIIFLNTLEINIPIIIMQLSNLIQTYQLTNILLLIKIESPIKLM